MMGTNEQRPNTSAPAQLAELFGKFAPPDFQLVFIPIHMLTDTIYYHSDVSLFFVCKMVFFCSILLVARVGHFLALTNDGVVQEK